MSSNLARIIASYVEGTRLLRESIRGMSREQLLARPVAGKWSTLEVVCHLADFDPIYADRMKRIIAEDRPQLLGADESRFAAALAYHQRELEEELAIVDHTRSQMARILGTLPAEALQRVGVHNERGPRTLEQLLADAIDHFAHHIPFIREKRRALGLSA
ncbi:MAG TPA: DinB family protein [Gemmataceae bacterium]|jgi:uncharacterized damage-inducible protein DinB